MISVSIWAILILNFIFFYSFNKKEQNYLHLIQENTEMLLWQTKLHQSQAPCLKDFIYK